MSDSQEIGSCHGGFQPQTGQRVRWHLRDKDGAEFGYQDCEFVGRDGDWVGLWQPLPLGGSGFRIRHITEIGPVPNGAARQGGAVADLCLTCEREPCGCAMGPQGPTTSCARYSRGAGA